MIITRVINVKLGEPKIDNLGNNNDIYVVFDDDQSINRLGQKVFI